MPDTYTRMLDAAFPPTTIAAAVALRDATGARRFGVYVGGWGRPYQATPTVICSALHAAGFQLLPILVPDPSTWPDGPGWQVGFDHAIEWMRLAGLTCPTIGVDVEAGWSLAGVVTSLEAATQEATGRNLHLVIYSSPSHLDTLATTWTVKPRPLGWVAAWAGVGWPSDVTPILPELRTRAWWMDRPGQLGGLAWQWEGGTRILGTNLDRSLIPATWPLSVALGAFAPPRPAPAPTAPPATAPAPTVTLTRSEVEGVIATLQAVAKMLEWWLA